MPGPDKLERALAQMRGEGEGKISGPGAGASGGAGGGSPGGSMPDSYFIGNQQKARQGKSVVIGNGFAAPVKDEIIRIEADDHDAQILSVTIAPNITPSDPAKSSPGEFLWLEGVASAQSDPICAVVEWGTGGYQTTAEVDVGQGVTFSLPASFLRVVVRLDLGLVIHPPGFKLLVPVGGFVSRNPMGGAIKPRRTRYFKGALAPGAAAEIDIPPFSQSMRIERGPAQNALTVNVLGPLGGSTPIYSLIVPAGVSIADIPLSNDALQVSVTNDDPVAALAAIRWIFGLAL